MRVTFLAVLVLAGFVNSAFAVAPAKTAGDKEMTLEMVKCNGMDGGQFWATVGRAHVSDQKKPKFFFVDVIYIPPGKPFKVERFVYSQLSEARSLELQFDGQTLSSEVRTQSDESASEQSWTWHRMELHSADFNDPTAFAGEWMTGGAQQRYTTVNVFCSLYSSR